MSDFSEAAKRRLSDALFLQCAPRLPNADHLAGIATECGLKAILIALGVLGQSGNTAPRVVESGRKLDLHCPEIWDHYMLLIGRHPREARLALPSPNPFSGSWSINDRYESGTACSTHRVGEHLQAAEYVSRLLRGIESGEL